MTSTTRWALARLEANAALRGAMVLFRRPSVVSATWDLDHLRAIHRRSFGSVYPWAGELRTVDIVKGTSRFANAEYLDRAAASWASRLRAARRSPHPSRARRTSPDGQMKVSATLSSLMPVAAACIVEQTGAEFGKCCCKAFLIRCGSQGYEVDVERLAFCTVQLRAEAADHHVLDAVRLQDAEDPSRIELRVLS
ncbi:MAG: hypothetical protein ABIP17_17060 [Ilumatobacteraceae bacterium]